MRRKRNSVSRIKETYLKEQNSTPTLPDYFGARADRNNDDYSGGEHDGIISFIRKDNKKFLSFRITQGEYEKDVSAGI